MSQSLTEIAIEPNPQKGSDELVNTVGKQANA